MIKNAREYRITRESIKRLEEALSHADDRKAERHPLLQKALRDSIEGEIEVRRQQLAEYEARCNGELVGPEPPPEEDLPDVLIRRRLERGISQGSLARRIGLAEDDIRRFEATRYADAGLGWVRTIARVLGLEMIIRPAPREDGPYPSANGPVSSAQAADVQKIGEA